MARRFRSSRLPTPTSRRSKPACISPWIGRAPFGSSEIDYDFQKMSSRAQIEKLTGIASRFGAFVAERQPFALTDALDAFEAARGGREPRTEAEIDVVRPLLHRELARRLQARDVPPGLAETTPRTTGER